MALQANDLFHGRYRLIEERGRGSFGEVWLARDVELDMDVAVKVYVALDEKGIDEFKEEYRTAYTLNHPNLLHAYHFDVCESRPYLVMPYCPNSAVSLVGNADEETIWHFIRDVSSGLDFLHSKEIIHRDIKPDNILQDADGVFKITDFGISMRLRCTLRRNSYRGHSDAETSGTIGYMAPELFSAEPDAVKATDIWALGVTVYEMLKGVLPFMGQGGVMLLHGAEVPSLGGAYSDELNEVVRACLSRDTWCRPTAEELSDYAQAHLSGKRAPMHWLNRGGDGAGAGDISDTGKQSGSNVKDRSRTTQRRVKTEGYVKDAEVEGSSSMPNEQSEKVKRKMPSWLKVLLCLLLFLVLVIVGLIVLGSHKNIGDESANIADPFADEMVFVEGGTFMMGAPEMEGVLAFLFPKQHQVTISDFYISKYEVTQEQWEEIMGTNPSYFKGDSLPVEMVSWEDVQEFIETLNARTGKNYRLPTEAEWEFATRGGNMSEGYEYSGSNAIDSVAWYGRNSDRRTHTVGQKGQNELGLYDMLGNVSEWCKDWYSYGYDTLNVIDPTGPIGGETRIFRGGSWYNDSSACSVWERRNIGPRERFEHLGFRLAHSCEAINGANDLTPTMESGSNLDEEIELLRADSIKNAVQGEARNRRDEQETQQKEKEGTSQNLQKEVSQNVPDPFAKDMVLVEGGTFIMGATSEQGSDASDWAKPAHEVTVSDFYISKYVVTQKQWRGIMGTNPSYFKGDNLPVENVSWDEVQDFIDKLNTKTGKNYRLPTEAEWEYAARGGNKGKGDKYSGSNDINEVAWYWDNSEWKTHSVGQKEPNELGLYDMSGNVWEWCEDTYSSYTNESQTNPKVMGGIRHVARGGSWNYGEGFCRVSRRSSNNPVNKDYDLGFRLARSL